MSARHRTAALAAVLLTLTSVAAPRPARAAWRDPVRARSGMVASSHPLATQVGVEVLRRGGNAVDAAVAVALALAVVLPWAGNIGGGGFMLVRLADGRAAAIDYRETAPAAAHRNVYLDAKGELIPEASLVGYRAAGVPGTPAGLDLALRRFGTMKWADLVEPARRLAADGFAVDVHEARRLAGEPGARLAKFEDSRKIFLRGGDRPYAEGEVLKQPELAATLARMQRSGPREFYEGETARLIAADMKANGGLITLEDLKGYAAKEREPLRASYRGNEIITMPPPSSGGIALIQMLRTLEPFDLASMGFGSSEVIHLEVEAMRRAFADRAEYLGDPDFVKVPVAGLLSPKYIADRAASIDPKRASTSAEVRAGEPARYESTDTTHFTVVDRDGNVASNTYTLNDYYGSGVVAKGTGVLLNDEMDDFAAKPGTPNLFGLIQGERNAVGPGRRPLSSMTPTIVARGGTLWFAVGSPGGPTIINTVLQTVVNVVDFKMNIQQAIDAPRVHHQWMPDEILHEPFGLAPDVQQALRARGHKLVDEPRGIGDAQGVMIEDRTGVRLGAADARGGGSAAGY
jgi:gamma-glutamyltranspeptidase / glutathione hydrolase